MEKNLILEQPKESRFYTPLNFYFPYAKLASAGVLLQAENIPAKGCPHGCPIT